jgi:hypothetical protein
LINNRLHGIADHICPSPLAFCFGYNLSNLIELEPNVIIKQRYFRALPVELLQSHLRVFGKTQPHLRKILSSKN